VPESTVRGFKKAYQQHLKIAGAPPTELPLKPRGKPLLLGKELDAEVQRYNIKPWKCSWQ
jgi:hypothetical protein